MPASRNDTSAPGIRPTGSLRIALGERCFREPTLQAALVRLTFQCMVGSRLPRQSAASIAEMPCRLPGVPRNTSRPLRSSARFEGVLAHSENSKRMRREPHLIFDN